MISASTRAVFLDRDGVLNQAVVRDGKPFSPANLADVVVPADVPAALERLRLVGFRLIMVTNQPDIARGLQSRQNVQAINQHLQHLLRLDATEVCEHDDSDDCSCRKPKPGMLLRAASRDRIALMHSFMVGDRWRDVAAGRRAGCKTVLIGDGYGEMPPELAPDVAVGALSEAASWILAQE